MNPKHLKTSFLLSFIVMMSSVAYSAIPSGYYSAAEGKKQQALLTALKGIIQPSTSDVPSYDGLWNAFKTTDVGSNGKLIDMYSNVEWTPGSKQCGNYSNVGSCYNREHSMPKSWFNEGKPMYSDLFHLYPTDGYVNNQRSNFPFGECANGTRLTNGSYYGKGKLGTSTYSGYTGKVFEPDDEYKGDFARTYFYMAAAYNDKISSWSTSSTNLGGTSYPCFNSWSVTMLMEWHRLDPVSAKEIARNEAVYGIQGNRNPFIDHPEMAEYIWGTNKDDAGGWTSSSSSTPTLSSPSAGSTINVGTTTANTPITKSITIAGSNLTSNITLSLSGTNSTLFALSSNSVTASAANSGTSVTVTYTPTANGTHTATLTLTSSDFTTRTVTLTGTASDSGGSGGGGGSSDVYEKITAENSLVAGRKLLIVYESGSKAMGTISSNSGQPTDITISSSNTITLSSSSTAHPITLGGSSGAWTLYDEAGSYYLTLSSASNALNTSSSSATWTISFSNGGEPTLTPNSQSAYYLRYNTSNNIFRCYKQTSGTGAAVAIYQQQASDDPEPEPTLTVSPTGTISFATTAGTASESQEVNITAENYSSSITVAVSPTTHFELSDDNGVTWSSSLTLGQLGGDISVRAKAIATAGTYNATLTASAGSLSVNRSLSVTVTAAPVPTLSAPTSGSTVNVGSTTAGSTTSTNISVSGSNLTEALTLAISGTNAAMFSVSPASVAAATANSGTTVAVTYTPTAAGSHTATLTISSSEVSATITLTGTATLADPVATAATGVSSSGFIANWDAVAGVDGYELHVYTVEESSGGTPQVSSLIFVSACGGTGTASDNVEWTVTSDGDESTYDSTKGIHYGTSKKEVQYIQLATSGISDNVSQVVVNASTASGVSATVSVSVGGTAFTCGSSTTPSLTESAADYTFTGTGSGQIVVRVEKPSSATKALYVKSIAVTHASGGGSQNVEITGSPFTVNGSANHSKAITGLAAETTYHYYVYGLVGGSTATAQSNVIDVTTSSGSASTPELVADPSSLTIASTTVGSTGTGTIGLLGSDLNGNVTVTVGGTDASLFSVSSSTISAADAEAGATVTVTYTPDAVGNHTATVTFSSAGAESVTVNVSASATEQQSGESTSMVFEKITSTSQLVPGRKIFIVYDYGNAATAYAFNGSLSTLDATSNYVNVYYDSNSNKATITADDTDITRTFTLMEGSESGKYYIQSASGKYIGHSGSSNNISTSDSASPTTTYDNTITFDSDGYANITIGSYNLRFNSTSGQTRFRYFSSTQQKIYLYQQQASVARTTLGACATNGYISEPVNIAFVDGNGIAYGCASAGDYQITVGNASVKTANAGTYSDNFDNYDQRDWIAIAGLSNASSYVGKTINNFSGTQDTTKPGYYFTASTQPTSVETTASGVLPDNEYQVHNLVASSDGNEYVRPQVYEYTTKFYAALKNQSGTWKAFGSVAGNDVSIAIDSSLFSSTSGWVESSGANYNTLEGVFVAVSGASHSPLRSGTADLSSQSYQFRITKAPTTEDVPTGITAIDTDSDAMKVRGIYNLQGQRVRETIPGQLYIINGVKTVARGVIRDTDF